MINLIIVILLVVLSGFFAGLTVSRIMITIKEVFFLRADTILTSEILKIIRQKGFIRIPVYETRLKSLHGILFTKNLIGLSPSFETKAGRVCSEKNLIIVEESFELDQILDLLVNRKMHMAFVVDKNDNFRGIAP